MTRGWPTLSSSQYLHHLVIEPPPLPLSSESAPDHITRPAHALLVLRTISLTLTRRTLSYSSTVSLSLLRLETIRLSPIRTLQMKRRIR